VGQAFPPANPATLTRHLSFRASSRAPRYSASPAFLLTGLTDYTYGHSLGLILFSYVSLAPLLVESEFQLLAPKGRVISEPVRYH